jgi:dephospho-CoA kinase
MIKIALTGIIGSGKTTAANYFKSLGIPIFIADDCAKELMTTDYELKTQMVNLLGELTYVEDKLNREFISDQIFNNKNLLASVNNLIHPRVQKAFDVWVNKQNSKYVVYEAALIFENNSDYMFDKIICIKTPLNIIHKRISNRKNYSKNRIDKIINSQLNQDIKCSKSDFCIENISKDKLFADIKKIHLSML